MLLFYTKDEYYINKAEVLAENLSNMGIAHVIEAIDIPEGKSWPDICRLKIDYIREIYLKNNDKKVFWIDVDCDLRGIPDFVADSSADIIGFQRGFQTPLRMGYHYKSRFWEPCFLGFNQTESTRKFLYDASRLEKEFEGRATDDYFFEESWRLNARNMSFQIIPSGYRFLEGAQQNSTIKPFFYFGASGNVRNYVDKVVQHSVPWISKKKGVGMKNVLKKSLKIVVPVFVIEKLKIIRAKKQSIDLFQFKKLAFEYGKKGNGENLEHLVKKGGGYQYISDKHRDVIKLAYSFLYYKKVGWVGDSSSLIKLAWWHLPEPGNYGDWLSPYIVNKITGKSLLFVDPRVKSYSEKHVFSIGSIGKFIKDSSVVLGTGISVADAELNPKADYRMVRGPYTRNQVIKAGGECPEIYGDPAVVLPLIYKPKIPAENGKSDKILFIRHFVHANINLKLPKNIVEKSIHVSHPSDIEEFIDELHAYSCVVTSAMHVYITCQAYDIACALVSFEGYEDSVHGDGVKYKDYLLGVGLDEKSPEIIPCDLVSYDFNKIIHNKGIEMNVKQNVLDVMKSTLNERA